MGLPPSLPPRHTPLTTPCRCRRCRCRCCSSAQPPLLIARPSRLLLLRPLAAPALAALLLVLPLLTTGRFMLTVDAADARLTHGPSGGVGQPGRCRDDASWEWSEKESPTSC